MIEPTIADYAASYVRQFGMAIVPLPPRTKRPLTENWGNDVITDPDQARAYYEKHPDWNMGAALGPSRLCSFDVDDIDATRLIFEEFGWDLDAMMQYPTIQGSPGGFRVMFRVPEGINLQYHALSWPKQDGSRGRFTVWEIRAADTQQRQDVLPPSIHPDTQRPYVWLTKPKADEGLPTPPDFLLQMWQHWDKLKPQFQAVCPWAEKPQHPARKPAAPPRADSVIDTYNTAHGIEEHLQRYGYKRQGKRYLSPHSTTGLPGVTVWPEANKCFIHHASDPLCSDESGQPVGPFDLLSYYDHGGDMKKAAKAAAEQLGMTRQRQAPAPAYTQAQPQIDPDTGEILDDGFIDAPANDNQAAIEPIDIFAEFPVPPIAYDMLPKAIADYAFDSGELIGVEPSMIAMPALVACAAALHDGVRIQPKRHETGWTESARLWCALVGSPSIKKSPAIKRATRRLRKIDMDLHDDNDKLAARYGAELEQFKDAKKEAKKTGEVVKAPDQPKMTRIVVEDITVEALSEVLKDNARGVLCVQDELSGWFGSMDAYSGSKSGGKDRAHWLEAYNGGGRVVDRVMRGSLKIPNWSVSMIGGIQPDAIRRIAQNMTDDGLMQRFMIIVGSNVPEQDRPENNPATKAYSDLVDHLYRVAPGNNAVTLTEDAHQVREALTAYATELAAYPALPGGLKTHLSKWSGLFARLLLLYHAIECAHLEHPVARQVSGDTARRVDRLMRKYLLPHSMAYYTDILGAATELEHARWIAGHILSKDLKVITLRDIQQHYKQWRSLDDWKRTRVMQTMEDMGWLIAMDDDRKSRRGAHTWAVNTAVHAKFKDRAAKETESRAKIREELIAMKVSA